MTVAIRPRSQSDYKQPIKKKSKRNFRNCDQDVIPLPVELPYHDFILLSFHNEISFL